MTTLAPKDLLDREPGSFASDDHQRIATAFKQGWSHIAAHVPLQEHDEARLRFAQLVFERAKWHPTLESLRNEVVQIVMVEGWLNK